ncbi:hypothetical protein OG405_09190 [Nocardia sp. NBC_01329]|nr:hypothetical protein OG405_09190 [Nocardia sp. NBC_01329]
MIRPEPGAAERPHYPDGEVEAAQVMSHLAGEELFEFSQVCDAFWDAGCLFEQQSVHAWLSPV